MSPTLKNLIMDWLRLERRIRDVLSTVKDTEIVRRSSESELRDAVYNISEIIGEETGRGFVLPENFK